MNQNQIWKNTFAEYKSQIAQNFALNEAKFKQLVKVETQKLLKNHSQGLDKNQLLAELESIFGSQNFTNGKYKGGQEVAIETIHDFFGKENFTNNKFTGGWNQKQDTEALQTALTPYKNWEQTQAQITQQTKQLIETKFGGSNKFENGVYQIEKETLQIVDRAFENKGSLLRKLRNILGESEFFGEEPGEEIPPGREGMRKDPEAIAMQNAEREARIKAVEAWREFYQDHGIVDSNEKLFWSNKYGSDVKTAEGVYKDALLKGEEVVGGDFTKLEENRILKAPTPEKIKEVLADIPIIRRKKAWENFFTNHDTLGNIKEEWKDNWRNSSLSIEVAKLIYNNGWYNSPNGLINNDKIIENYTTKVLVMGQEYEQTTTHIETLKHVAEEVDKVHEFIVKRIETETNLDDFPDATEIQKVYSEKLVPDTRSWKEISKLRDNRIKVLFKQYFQGSNPTNLTDEQIELYWTTLATSGLPNTGKDQRIAYENGWTTPQEIKSGKVDYQNITGIEVLKVKKIDIDNEISKVNNLVQQINSYKFLRDLDANQASIDKQFTELNRELLPPNKDKEITEAIQKQRQNLFYSLTDPADGGLPEETLKKLSANLQNTWNVPNYEPMTVAKLNAFISADKDVQALGLFQNNQKWEDLNESGWLKRQGGYELPKEKTTAEDKLHISQKGAYLLDFFYKKSKDGKGYPFNPDKLTDPQIHFAQIGTKMVKKFKKKMLGKGEWIEEPTQVIGGDKGNSGHLAIGTGIGKTTKLINCLVKGGERHIILVCPTQGLADSALKHHLGWLQGWGCVYHGGIKGEVEMAYCLRGKPNERANEEEIKLGKHDPEMKSLYKSHGSYPVTKNDLSYWLNANTNQKEGKEPDKKGLSIMYFGNLLGFASRNLFVETGGVNSWSDENLKTKVKEKQIPKEETIIVFDEAHFNDAGYQALQFEMIKAGYKYLRMSATFPGAEFSTTSSFSMKRVHCDGPFDPKMPGHLMIYQNAEQVEQLEQLRQVPTGSIKWKDENGSPIPIEVNLDERLQTGNTWIFGKNLELNEEQVRALGSNVSYMVYTPEFEENCEDISFGRPRGSVDNVDGRYEMGFTPYIHTVVCLGVVETTNLQKFFTYSEPTLGFTQISSLMQQMGRVSRITYGLAITLTKECGEMDLSDNVSAAMVKATFDGDIKQINDKEYKQIYDIDILRGALAFPDVKTFGKAPEEILMGLKISKDQQSKKEKLSQLVWRQDNDADKQEAMAKPWYAFMAKDINPSEKLWNRYLGKSEAITMGEETAKNLLKEMISNFITQDKNYPQGLNLEKKAKFIGSVFGQKLESGKKEEVIKETRTVLNGLVEAKINELASKDYDETNKRSKNPNTIKKLAGLYKLTGAEIDYQKMKNEEGKLVWSLVMRT